MQLLFATFPSTYAFTLSEKRSGQSCGIVDYHSHAVKIGELLCSIRESVDTSKEDCQKRAAVPRITNLTKRGFVTRGCLPNLNWNDVTVCTRAFISNSKASFLRLLISKIPCVIYQYPGWLAGWLAPYAQYCLVHLTKGDFCASNSRYFAWKKMILV